MAAWSQGNAKRKMLKMEKSNKPKVETTGHVWDGDLAEYNNPLPTWWVWAFYGTVIFSIVYWFIFPAWPIGKSFTPGLLKETVQVNGQEVTSHWNTRIALIKDMQKGREQQAKFYNQISGMTPQQISKDPQLMGFVQSAGAVLFGDNCAACHRAGGQGTPGVAPALVDDDWLYGGTLDKIQETITNGRHGFMPAFGQALKPQEIAAIAEYELSLSGHSTDANLAKAGDALFHSDKVGCFGCHGVEGKGNQMIGSANLTDNIWLWAKVDPKIGAPTRTALENIISNGLNRGVMPAWAGRLSPDQIKILTVYVHELGGGQ